MTDLGTLGGDLCIACDVNDDGDVVVGTPQLHGSCSTPFAGHQQA